MRSFLSFVALALASVVVSSPLESGMATVFDKRAQVVCSDPNEQAFISASYSEAKALATGAAQWISTHGTGDLTFVSYFGVNNPSKPLDVFNAAANENNPAIQLSCNSDTATCAVKNVPSYIDAGNIFYCPSFFNTVDTAQLCPGPMPDPANVRGVVTLNQTTALLSGISDLFDSGCAGALTLAATRPDFAVGNNANYNCFAMAVYGNTHNC